MGDDWRRSAALLRGSRLRVAERRSRGRDPAGERSAPSRHSHRQLAYGGRGQPPNLRVRIFRSSATQKSRHGGRADWLWSPPGGIDSTEDRGHPAPRRALDHRGPEGQGRAYPNRAGSGLGEGASRRLDGVGMPHHRDTLPSNQQGWANLGKRLHSQGHLVHSEKRPRRILSCPVWPLMIVGGPVQFVPSSRRPSWSPSNSFWGMFRLKRQNAISDASNGSATP